MYRVKLFIKVKNFARAKSYKFAKNLRRCIWLCIMRCRYIIQDTKKNTKNKKSFKFQVASITSFRLVSCCILIKLSLCCFRLCVCVCVDKLEIESENFPDTDMYIYFKITLLLTLSCENQETSEIQFFVVQIIFRRR